MDKNQQAAEELTAKLKPVDDWYLNETTRIFNAYAGEDVVVDRDAFDYSMGIATLKLVKDTEKLAGEQITRNLYGSSYKEMKSLVNSPYPSP